jgi:WD40 repeat protein
VSSDSDHDNGLHGESVLKRIDSVADRYDAAWRAALNGGPLPQLNDFFSQVAEADKPALQCELDQLDLEYHKRLSSGEPQMSATVIGQCELESQEVAAANDAADKISSTDNNQRTSGNKVVDEYELLDEIGHGGMGLVYEAKERRTGRIVALKMILSNRTSREATRRFLLEAEMAANLDHAHIVPIYHVGEHEGQPYFCMKLVEGKDLANMLKSGAIADARHAAQLVETISRAVHFAHSRGILHRDLKPANILIDRQGEPHVTDFGLAKRLDSDAGLTHAGQIVGTPAYMAPEQMKGELRLISVATDVYALGVILFELLTNRRPFQAEDGDELYRQIQEVPPPSPRSLNSQVPADLETVCLKCLEKDPAARYASAEALAEDLRRFQNGEPIKGRRVGRIERAWRWCRREPVLAAISAIAALALLTTFIISVAFAIQKSRYATGIQQRLAQSYLERGQASAETGEVGPALLHMARALETVPEHDVELDRVIRENLAVWGARYIPAERVLHHPAPVTSVAFSPTNLVLTGCTDGKARLWDLVTERPLFEVPCSDEVLAVAFSVNGLRLATGEKSAATIRNAMNGEPVGRPLEHPDRVQAIAFSPDGQMLLTGCADGLVRLWRIENSAPISEWKHEGPVYSVAFHRSGKFAITASHDRTAKIWDVQTGECVAKLQHMTIVLQAGFWSDTRVVTSTLDKAQFWALPEEHPGDDSPGVQPISPGFQHNGTLWGLAISQDGRRIVTAGDDKFVRVWNQTGKPLATFRHTDAIRSVAISPDGTSVVAAGDDRTVRVWPMPNLEAPDQRRLEHRHQINCACFSADGRFVLTASHDQTAGLWDAATGQVVSSFAHEKPVRQACFCPDEKLILTVDEAWTARLWNTREGRIVQEFKHNAVVPSAACRPKSSQFATACHDSIVRLWDGVEGRLLHTMKHDDMVLGVSFSPDGHYLASWSQDRTARIWNSENGKLVVAVRHDGPIRSAAWSPDNSMLATGGDDNLARIWHVPFGKPVSHSFEHHEKPGSVGFVEFSPDGQLLLTTSTDKTVRLWSVLSGDLVRTFLHNSTVGLPAFHSSGRLVATGECSGADGKCQLWDTLTGLRVGPSVSLNWGANATFSPDGSKVLFYAQDRLAHLARVPEPVDGDPNNLTLWVQALTGTELDREGVLRQLDAETMANRRRRVEALMAGKVRVSKWVAMPSSREE